MRPVVTSKRNTKDPKKSWTRRLKHKSKNSFNIGARKVGVYFGSRVKRKPCNPAPGKKSVSSWIFGLSCLLCVLGFILFFVSFDDNFVRPPFTFYSPVIDLFSKPSEDKDDGPSRFSSIKQFKTPYCPAPWKYPELNLSSNSNLLRTWDPIEWIKFPVIENETKMLLHQIERNGSCECHNVQTVHNYLVGFPKQDGRRAVKFTAGPIHEFWIVSVGEDGHRRCSGGDYYEADLKSNNWKSRPLVLDNGDGTYHVKMQVDPRFAGYYTLKVVHLYHNFHAFDPLWDEEYCMTVWPEKCGKGWLRDIQFVLPPRPTGLPESAIVPDSDEATALRLPELKMCKRADYKLKQWSGRWTREKFNDTCELNSYGRFKCLPRNTKCEGDWCSGPIDRLDSNGWVYSQQCKFKIFRREEAWQCLDKKWIFWWGDSQHQDTLSNLLNYVLGCHPSSQSAGRGGIARKDDRTYFRNPLVSTDYPSQLEGRCHQTHSKFNISGKSVRFTNLFNGHEKLYQVNNHGLASLRDESYEKLVRGYFEGNVKPDVIILNSGLHDGCFWSNLQSFVQDGLELGANFWKGILDGLHPHHPRVVYHTSVAVAGDARLRGFNPHKMEVYNKLMVERLQRLNLTDLWVVDGFDLTFPWHFNHDSSDGPHYGIRSSRSSRRNPDGKYDHKYFVDLMLVHILLNAICENS